MVNIFNDLLGTSKGGLGDVGGTISFLLLS